MKASRVIVGGFSRWLDSVAGAAVAWHARLAPRHVVKLVEDERGELVPGSNQDSGPAGNGIGSVEGQIMNDRPSSLAAIVPGSHVEVTLEPRRFLFQPLELPGRATEFLDGVVRAQIDRLTPWRAGEAAFGWSNPVEIAAGRIMVTIAAAPLASLMSTVQAIVDHGAHSVAAFTVLPDQAEAVPIKVLEQSTRDELKTGRIRQKLLRSLIAGGLAAGAAIVGTALIAANLEVQQEELARQIASVRSGATVRDGAMGSAAAAQQRKHESPSSVLILETLSRILPDHTYVTELRIDGNRLWLTGVTQDAPSLIQLLEQSAGFARASFSAPTTRSPSDPGERFQIEILILPSASHP